MPLPVGAPLDPSTFGGLSTKDTVDNTDWSGVDLSIANGGTGASTAAGARTNLGLGDLAIQNTVSNEDWDGADLAVSNGGTGSSTASGARTNLGLGDLATQNTVNNGDWNGSDLAISNGGTGSSTAGGARTNLGLGSVATQDSNNIAITGGSITGTEVTLETFTVAGAPSGSVGRIGYCTDGDAGSACFVVHDGTDWKVLSLGATISST